MASSGEVLNRCRTYLTVMLPDDAQGTVTRWTWAEELDALRIPGNQRKPCWALPSNGRHLGIS